MPTTGSATAGPRITQAFAIKALDSIWLPAAYQPVEIKDINDVSYNAESGSLISANETTDGLLNCPKARTCRRTPRRRHGSRNSSRP